MGFWYFTGAHLVAKTEEIPSLQIPIFQYILSCIREKLNFIFIFVIWASVFVGRRQGDDLRTSPGTGWILSLWFLHKHTAVASSSVFSTVEGLSLSKINVYSHQAFQPVKPKQTFLSCSLEINTINWRQIIACIMASRTLSTCLQIKLFNLESRGCTVYAQLTPYGCVKITYFVKMWSLIF